VSDGVNGLLVPSHPDGTARSGIPARRPDVAAMAAAIERLADPETLAGLRAGTERSREGLSWKRTLTGLAELLQR
jgi:glycosyltransferase involved in cell wall biosynthesis